MMMKPAIVLVAAVMVLATGTAHADVLCKKKSGKLFARSACRASEAEVSLPTGAQGPTGPQGPAGPKGPYGGVVNALYSPWKMVGAGFTDQLSDGFYVKRSTITASEITQNVIDRAQVRVYMRFGSQVFPLEYISRAGGAPNSLKYRLSAGQIVIERVTFGCTTTPCLIGASSSLEYRYVIIPGDVAS